MRPVKEKTPCHSDRAFCISALGMGDNLAVKVRYTPGSRKC